MDREVLSGVVALGGKGLEAEDRVIRGYVAARGESGGILRRQDERYYQHVVWRSVLARWNALLERNPLGAGKQIDLEVMNDGTPHYFEMECWLSKSGKRELKGIRTDVEMVGRRPNGYMLVFSANPPGTTKENLAWLESQHRNPGEAQSAGPGLREDSREIHMFLTQDAKGDEVEFWIAGWAITV